MCHRVVLPGDVIAQPDQIFSGGGGSHDRYHWIALAMPHENRKREVFVVTFSLEALGVVQVSGDRNHAGQAVLKPERCV